MSLPDCCFEKRAVVRVETIRRFTAAVAPIFGRTLACLVFGAAAACGRTPDPVPSTSAASVQVQGEETEATLPLHPSHPLSAGGGRAEASDAVSIPASGGADAAPGAETPAAISIHRLAYIGCFGTNGVTDLSAVIQDVVLRRSVSRKRGQAAFGYTLIEIRTNAVLLERRGEQFHLALGANRNRIPGEPRFNPANYPPYYIRTSDSDGRPMPALPPPESQSLNPGRVDDFPPHIQARLRERSMKEPDNSGRHPNTRRSAELH